MFPAASCFYVQPYCPTRREWNSHPSRVVARLLQRTLPTSLQNLGNYSAEVSEPNEWQVFTPAVHLPKRTRPSGQVHASFGARGRVVFCLCLPCDGQNTVINREFFTFCLVVSTFFVTLCRPSQSVVAGRAIKNFMESRLSHPTSPSATGGVKRAFVLGGGG